MPKNKIVAIHSCDGCMLQRLSDRWMTTVKPNIPAPYQVIPVLGADASRRLNPQQFTQTLSDGDVVLITGLGHGDPDAFIGWKSETLYSSQLMPPTEVNQKIVHLLSCSTANGLNDVFKRAGCRAFIGYKIVVPIDSSDQEWTDNFLLCDSQVDVRLARGQNVSAAVKAAKTYFSIFLPNDPTGDSLMCGPDDGNVSLPPTMGMAAPAVLAESSIGAHSLAGTNAITSNTIKSAGSF